MANTRTGVRHGAAALLGLAVLFGGASTAHAAPADAGTDAPGAYELVPPAHFRDLVWMDDSPEAQGARAALAAGSYPPGVSPLGTAYGRDGHVTVVVSGVRGPVADPAAGLARGIANLRAAGTLSEPREFAPGRLGGELECATLQTSTGPVSACGWADHSSVVMTVSRTAPSLPAYAGEIRGLRDAMEVPRQAGAS